MSRTPDHGFTLIELLVVITIIVILLAMLTPAMHQAIYQAQLTVCSAQLKTVASGVTLYAIASNRSYPYRPGVHDAETLWFPHYFYAGALAPGTGLGVGATYDDRVPLEGVVELDSLVDPLCTGVDLSLETNGRDVWAASSYSLWYGWKFAGQKGNFRIGDRFGWRGGGPFAPMEFRYLATDVDQINRPYPNATTSHPDKHDTLAPFWAQGGRYEDAEGADSEWSLVVEQLVMTFSFWRVTTTYERGPMDLNAVSADGAVVRVSNYEFDDTERTTRVPVADNNTGWGSGFTRYHNLPKP